MSTMSGSANGKTYMEEVRDGVQATNKILGNHVLSALGEQKEILCRVDSKLNQHTEILIDIRDTLRNIAEGGGI
ncbi:MAG: hypothetical protein OXG60_04695 [Chloroflexi bacterium]|nr:hypothetical protein [Chloroflexota bacterium]